MRRRLVVALVGLAISFALPTFAQQTDKPDPQLRQQFIAAIQKHADAMNSNDAAAAAALHRGWGLCYGQRTDQWSGGYREVVCRSLPETAFQRSCHHDRPGFALQHGSG